MLTSPICRKPISAWKFMAPLVISIIVALSWSMDASAQFVVHNNGASVTLTQFCVASILEGNLDNDAGSIDNLGILTVEGDLSNDEVLTGGGGSSGMFTVSGDWENNDVFTSDQSIVNLNGDNQLITGTASSSFYNLTLLGTGIKSMDIDASITGTLEINDLEMATQGNILSVLNGSSSAVSSTTGFVSSLGDGRLSWDMNSMDTYLFPLGSSSGTLRVRPLSVTPTTAASNTFAVRMANVDATTEGYDVNLVGSEVCVVNDLYYHLVDHVSGTSAADIKQFYNAIEDGDWLIGAHWQNLPQWEDMGNEILDISGSYNTVNVENWSGFEYSAFALAKPGTDVDLPTVSPLCEQGNSIVLSATPPGGSYSGNGVNNDIFDPTVAGLGTHTITYSYTDSYGCMTAEEIQIEVNENPTPIATALGPTEFCEGDGVTLSTEANMSSYLWDSTGSTTPTTYVTESGDYFVTVTNQLGCEGISNSILVDVTPMIVPVILENGNILTADPPGSGYQWFFNGNPIPGATDISYEALGSGNYQVQYTGPNGCPAISYILEFTFSTGIIENSVFNSLDLFPNPGKGHFIIKGDLSSIEDVTIAVTNMLGQQLLPAIQINSSNQFEEPIDISPFANGVYFIQVFTTDGLHTIRYVKS
jgi:hypothetical protein